MAVAVEAHDARRAEHVVDCALVDARVPADARIRAAVRGSVARSAGDAAVARQLLVPEQHLAEHALRFGDRVLGRHGDRRQCGDGDVGSEEEQREGGARRAEHERVD